jgi:hypothetical protein
MPKILHKGKFRSVHSSGKGDYINVPLAKGPDGKLRYKRKYLKPESKKPRIGAGHNECIQGPKRCVSLARKVGKDVFRSTPRAELRALLEKCMMGEKGRCKLSESKPKPRVSRRSVSRRAVASRSVSPARRMRSIY